MKKFSKAMYNAVDKFLFTHLELKLPKKAATHLAPGHRNIERTQHLRVVSRNSLPPEDELLRVHQAPQDVLQFRAAVGGRIEKFQQLF
jgi:hypothetical protein